MTSLLQIRDLIALYGQADIALLSEQLNTPVPLIQAMVEKLISLEKIEQVDINACLTGSSCKGCPESTDCAHFVYKIK
ncbi:MULTISPECIES: FeoC-like transcriptional regulator [Providencia]|uniref:FeoC-like transcriptional regulator n=1 Tax=Providencia TaxID=586 RepID=UPI000D6FA444|nr:MULTISPECIES: FeoC-like transcriptional regulator [Providencia]ELR5287967.1 ferrous iron transporter C [Providencia rettgeri]ELR5296666.1 ferrous iron transporter C [Providencia rettgeri]MBG5900397.1 ferrous iron transporter C [Providencia rettgeri]MBI6194416.1 ferrous iron transporter C [Providencia rettgeri]MBS0916028.1 ferrous iron transporter C [Providencia rettgeri]